MTYYAVIPFLSPEAAHNAIKKSGYLGRVIPGSPEPAAVYDAAPGPFSAWSSSYVPEAQTDEQ